MANKPVAEVDVDERQIRALLAAQAGAIENVATLPLVHIEEGWDCSIWRLGEELAVRIPRRKLAAPLIEHEQKHLPAIAARMTHVGVPAPIVKGTPDDSFPWPWSVVPWFPGQPGLSVARPARSTWARPLAEALRELHVPTTGQHPPNPHRGGPLAARDEWMRARLSAADAAVSARAADALHKIWHSGLAAPAWIGPPVWIHGDLHPGNIITRGGELTAIIDFGDITAGDPAYDIAIAWLAFDEHGAKAFRAAADGRYDEATWTRAHAWAAAMTLILLHHSDDNPAYRTLGQECLEMLASSRLGSD